MIGENIKYYRLKRYLSQADLAKKIGCTQKSISLYESNKVEPKTEMIKKIAYVLDVSWTRLLMNTTHKESDDENKNDIDK